jgi:hypothetical protein
MAHARRKFFDLQATKKVNWPNRYCTQLVGYSKLNGKRGK